MIAAALLMAVGAAASAEAPPICADRPAKATGVCTVPAGQFQIETGTLDWTVTKSGGARTELLAIGAIVVKYGVSDASDLELGFVPALRLTVKEAGTRSRASGFGDVTLRFKQRLTGTGAGVQVAMIPFVKLPTAGHDLGNGKAEGGLAVPVSFTLAGPVTMTLGPEIDLLADTDGSGRHVGLTNLVTLSATVAPRVTIGGELWSSQNFEPSGTIWQTSADAAIAYAASPRVQLDLGANFGLTRHTPDLELYTGASIAF
ncbi:transporter [Sphingomonas sp.]|uniref:transporter n=1 Tax=Sphingomonas sp. TaxID=28214 RepID=UPI00286A728F|nr:transporter [Sphingomonas sp.]